MIDNMKEILKFPEEFLWGTGTSAHQVEGGNHNQWSEWEKRTAKAKVAAAGKKQWPDFLLRTHPSPLEEENYISGVVCDHYNRYEEDFDLAKGLNNNAHRFSIEWSRVEPEEGKFNRAEIEHYRKVIRALRARGMEPFVTLWHWTMPIWFADMGAFEKKENIEYFVRFCGRIAEEFKDEVKFWIVLNEPNVYTGQSYLAGIWPPQKKSLLMFLKVMSNLAEAHNKVYRRLHDINNAFQVGIAHQVNHYEGILAPFIKRFWNKRFLNKVKNRLDFTGFNYYYTKSVGKISGKKWPLTDMDWPISPEGIYHSVKLVSRYGKPIYITENGLADAQDKHRNEFIVQHLKWIHKAISEGADVRGYFHWSLLDNFEWAHGFWPRFGLIEIDYGTLERKPRLSSKVYGEIAKANGIPKGIQLIMKER